MLEWVGNVPVGLWLIPGIIMVPVYGMILAWFLGRPRNMLVAFRGLVYLIAMIVLLWGGMALVSLLIKYVFFN